jgi:glycosyltransferase involved in cell wall biosynthesis
MLEFMAVGLPIVTTPVGARGLERSKPPPFEIVSAGVMGDAIRLLLADEDRRLRLAEAARSEAVEAYSWTRISNDLGRLLSDHAINRHQAPFVSVVVPTYERPEQLSALIERIERQTFSDFEVIVVDQSSMPWPDRYKKRDCRLRYFHTEVRGAVNARNKGAYYARGQVIAFVDDDCLPNADWLGASIRYFSRSEVVGIEGLIVSSERDNPKYRVVTNEDFRGFGFMTANLFIRRETFYALNGFDLAFDRPHFREDTDLGWRALALGEIPFADDVIVYHPPHPVSLERESMEERVKFFEKDALLFAKHPERYKELFFAEGHWRKTAGFWEHFLRGHEKYGVPLDPFFHEYMGRRHRIQVLAGDS